MRGLSWVLVFEEEARPKSFRDCVCSRWGFAMLTKSIHDVTVALLLLLLLRPLLLLRLAVCEREPCNLAAGGSLCVVLRLPYGAYFTALCPEI